MTLLVEGNLIQGSLEIETKIAANDFYNVAFTNNMVDGNVALRAKEISKNIHINGCNFDNNLTYMSPEIWFMYINIFVYKKNITNILNNYALGKIYGLRFNIPSVSTPFMSEYTYRIVVKCLEFLKKYHNPLNNIKLTWLDRLKRWSRLAYIRINPA